MCRSWGAQALGEARVSRGSRGGSRGTTRLRNGGGGFTGARLRRQPRGWEGFSLVGRARLGDAGAGSCSSPGSRLRDGPADGGARLYVERLAELAPPYDFGFAERKIKPQPAQNAAAYLSSYFVKGKRGKETLWESARSRGGPHPPLRRVRVRDTGRDSLRRERAAVAATGADCLSTNARRRADATGRQATAPASAALARGPGRFRRARPGFVIGLNGV
jgi:hypothetical protein